MTERLQEGEILLFITSKSRLSDALSAVGATELKKTDSGAPYIENSDLKVSLSHKGDRIAFAVSLSPVGVDVEDVTVPRNVERLSRLFHETEKPDTLYDFYKIWTKKEAEGKRRGTGIDTEILRTETPGGVYFDHGDYLICVVGEGNVTLREML